MTVYRDSSELSRLNRRAADEPVEVEPRLFDLLSATPARLLGLPAGGLSPGDEADLVLIDDGAPWKIDADNMPGIAGNTPFDGLPVQGVALKTIKGGQPLG